MITRTLNLLHVSFRDKTCDVTACLRVRACVMCVSCFQIQRASNNPCKSKLCACVCVVCCVCVCTPNSVCVCVYMSVMCV